MNCTIHSNFLFILSKVNNKHHTALADSRLQHVSSHFSDSYLSITLYNHPACLETVLETTTKNSILEKQVLVHFQTYQKVYIYVVQQFKENYIKIFFPVKNCSEIIF